MKISFQMSIQRQMCQWDVRSELSASRKLDADHAANLTALRQKTRMMAANLTRPTSMAKSVKSAKSSVYFYKSLTPTGLATRNTLSIDV